MAALAIRLFANMIAGHVLLAVYPVELILSAGTALGAAHGLGYRDFALVAASVAVTLLEVFVAFLQAFIFAFLTALFIGLSVVFHNDDHHEKAAAQSSDHPAKAKGGRVFSQGQKTSKFALLMIVIGLALMLVPGAAHAQTEGGAAVTDGSGSMLNPIGAGRLGGTIGAGLVVMGAGAGINGRIGAAAVE